MSFFRSESHSLQLVLPHDCKESRVQAVSEVQALPAKMVGGFRLRWLDVRVPGLLRNHLSTTADLLDRTCHQCAVHFLSHAAWRS